MACAISAPQSGQVPPGCRAGMTSPVCTPAWSAIRLRAVSTSGSSGTYPFYLPP